ncbi:hypothetical protein C6W64_000925 [Blautia sp. SG-772]|nr:hypothetical protein C6W64_000925 [Blautia sp. SG-772]
MSKVLKTIVNVILFCAIVVAAGLLIPPFAGITTVMVDDVDMQTNLPQGSVAYAVEKDRSELKQGDKVLISQEGRQYVYVVDSIDGSSVVLDDQLSTDGGTTQQELGSTVQKVMLVVPVIGYVSMALRSTEGLIIVGLAVVFVIILFILAEVWKKDDDEEEDEEDEDEDGQEDESEEEPAVMSRRQKKKARKADKKKQKQEEKAAVAEAKARAKRERQEAKLAKKNKKAHMMDEPEQEPEAIPAEPMKETQAAGSTQEIVLPQELMQEEQSAGNTQEIVLPTEEPQEKQESTDETEDPDKTLLEETASLFAADIASMMGENQTKETEKPEETDPSDSTEQTQPVVLEVVPEEKQETGDKKLAMPVYTKEELLQKAEADGDEPEVIEDEVSGVTLVDYSDVL